MAAHLPIGRGRSFWVALAASTRCGCRMPRSPTSARFLLFQAVADAVRDAAPVLLVLDDLQWADEPSLRLLDALGAHVGPAPVLVVGTYRDTEPDSPAISSITAERRFVLRGLSAEQLVPAVADLTGEMITPDAAADLHRRTGGNPFFAAEVVRLQRAEGTLGTDTATPVPGGVRAVLDRRLDRLPEPAEAVLRAAAALDAGTTTGVDAVLLATVSGHAPAELATVLEPTIDARLLRDRKRPVPLPPRLGRRDRDGPHAGTQRLQLHRRAGESLRCARRGRGRQSSRCRAPTAGRRATIRRAGRRAGGRCRRGVGGAGGDRTRRLRGRGAVVGGQPGGARKPCG